MRENHSSPQASAQAQGPTNYPAVTPLSQAVRPFTRGEMAEILLGVLLAHRLRTPPVWLWPLAPPSSGKTSELDRLPCQPPPKPGQKAPPGAIIALDALTARTLASGLRDTADAGLLDRLEDGVLVAKELSSFSGRDFRQVMAQLRRVYDGAYAACWGTGRTMDWRGRISLIIAGTRHPAEVDAEMGARMLVVRLAPEPTDYARLLGEGASLPPLKAPDLTPTLTEDHLRAVEPIAQALAVARTHVARDRQGEVVEPPEPESPHRLIGQLGGLGASLAALRGGEVDVSILHLLWRIAAHTVPPVRMAAALTLAHEELPVGEAVKRTAELARVSEGTAWRALDDLRLLGLVESRTLQVDGRRGRPCELLSLGDELVSLVQGAGIQ